MGRACAGLGYRGSCKPRFALQHPEIVVNTEAA
jgi:hypothetical protein